ncbi:MAG: putative inorganic carbon (HCO3(-)) transporter [Salibacteraceae bacterium]
MEKQLSYKIFYQALGLFAILNAFFIYMEVFYFVAVPIALTIVVLAVFKLDWLLMLIMFTVPFSLTVEDVGGGMGLTLPTDPLLFGAMVVFLLKNLFEGNYDVKIIKNPVTISIIAMLVWMFFSVLFSRLPLVSVKFFLAKLWFIIPFFFAGVLLFKNPKNIVKVTWLFVVPMAGVIIYTIARQYARGFDIQAAHWVMQPFFSDHTGYGAMMAFFIPAMFSHINNLKWEINTKILAGVILGIFLIGTILSYTRAAWASLFIAIALWGLIRLKVRWWIVALSGVTVIALAVMFWVPLMHKLEKNRQDSSGDIAEHVESMSNVATDASNLERLNRWSAAFKMFGESPLVGTGPGTYSFLYAPYQLSSTMTLISTNFGDMGNAHSEYFGVLAEQGVPGLALWLMVIFFVFYRGIITYYRLQETSNKALIMGAILGLTTYLSHGVLNNFLDTDKAAVPFWAFVAIIVAMDVYYEREDKERSSIK